MPKDHNDLRREAAELVAQAQAIQDKIDAENRTATAEEEAEINRLLAEAADKRRQADLKFALLTATEEGQEAQPTAELETPVSRPIPRTYAAPRDLEEEGRCGFESLGEFAIAVRNATDPRVMRRDSRLELLSTMQQGVQSEGGVLVPPTFSTKIWDGLNDPEQSLLARCDQYTVTGESLTFPANAETTRATGSRYGGILAYWLAEGAQMTASNPTLRQLTLEPHEMAVMVVVTDKLLRNSPVALEQYLSRAATEEINFMVGDAILWGTGVGKPKGIMVSNCLVTASKEASQVDLSVTAANIRAMWTRLHTRAKRNAIWLVNQEMEEKFDAMFTPVKNVAGTENVGGFQDRVYNPEARTLKGRPIVECEFCEKNGWPGDIILADMSMYAAGVRGGVRSASSIHLYFDYNKTAFRFLFEVDGQPWLQSALTPYKGTATLSTFVVLEERHA